MSSSTCCAVLMKGDAGGAAFAAVGDPRARLASTASLIAAFFRLCVVGVGEIGSSCPLCPFCGGHGLGGEGESEPLFELDELVEDDELERRRVRFRGDTLEAIGYVQPSPSVACLTSEASKHIPADFGA